MEKLQRFSIRKLSIGAVSCLIGTVSFLSYSHNVQAAEKPQTVETVKAENEIQPENVQESKPSEEVKGNTQKTVVDDVEVKPKESSNVDTNEQKENDVTLATGSPASKTNVSSKPVQTVSPEQSADITDVQPASDQVESAAANSNAPENDVSAALASTVLSKQSANADTPLAATTSGVQPFLNLAVESDNNNLTPKHETVDSTWTLHYVNQADHKQELKDPTVITMQYERTNTPQSDGKIQYGDWSYVPGSFKQTGTQITVNDSDNPVKQDNVDKNGENFDVFTITAMYPTVAGYGFYNGINGTRLHDNLRNNDRQADAMSKDFYAEYDVVKPMSDTVTSKWTIHYVKYGDHQQELKAPTVITMQYTRTNTLQSNGKIQYGDWSYVPGSFKLTGTPIAVNGSDNPVKEDNIDKDGKNFDVFSIIVQHPNIKGYELHNGINGVSLNDYLQNDDSNGGIQIQAPTMSKDGYVEYDVAKERSVAVKFVDDQFDERQVGQAITLTGHDGDTVNLNLTVPDKYQLADGQQLPTTYTFAKGSGDLKIHLVHQVVQREATIDVKLGLMTEVYVGDGAFNGYGNVFVIPQSRWKQLDDKIKKGIVSPDGMLYAMPSVEVGTLKGHVDYDPVYDQVVSLQNDWTSLNLGGQIYQLPNGMDVVNGIVPDPHDEPFGYKLRADDLVDDPNIDPDYVNRPWHGYLSVNATNNAFNKDKNDDSSLIYDVYNVGLQAGLAGNEPNALAKATGDRAATAVEMSNKPIDLDLLRGYNFEFNEQDGQLKGDAVLPVAGFYIPYVEKTATRTINVTTPDGKTTTVEQTATLAKQVDFGKDAHPAWTTGEWTSYNAPVIPGYTASQSQVAKETVTGTTKDQTVNITYTANSQTSTVVYQTEDGTPVHTTTVNGHTGQTVKVSNEVPVGWHVVNGTVPSEITFGPNGTPKTVVTIAHSHATVTSDAPKTTSDKLPDNPGKTYPSGVGHDDLNKTVTRTIKVTTPDGQTKTIAQTAKLTRTADVDEVTGNVTYGDWTTDEWSAYAAPSVPGYTANQPNIADQTVTNTTKDATVTITYTANEHQISIEYVDNTTGQVVKTDHVSGKTGQTVPITPTIPDGWELVSGQSVPSEVTLGADGAPATVIKVQPQERSVTVKFVDDQSFDFDTSDRKKQVGQAITVTGRDGDTVNLNLTVPDKYQLADGQQLPITYTFAKGSGDLKIHLVHKVVQLKATVDVKLDLMTAVRIYSNHEMPFTVTQDQWKQLEAESEDVDSPDELVPSVKAGTLTGHVNYDLVNKEVLSFGDDWTSLNLGGQTYQLPNGDEVVNGVMAFSADYPWGKTLKEFFLKNNTNTDSDYANRPWHGYLSVNATNNEDIRRIGLQAGLVGDESNALAKATGDHAATGIEMANKTINLGWLQDYMGLSLPKINEQDGQVKYNTSLDVAGVYVPYVEKTMTRTINITTPGGKTTTVKQTATLAKQIDFGKDAHPAWTTGEWTSYDVPTIPGYTASQGQIAKTAVTGTTEDQIVNITYTANDGTQTIVYQGEDGSEIGKQVITGKTDQTVKVTPDVPDGYVVKGEIPTEVTIKPADNPITVTVEHGESHVTPDKPVNKGDLIPDTKDKHYPEGLTHNDLNKTITREVTITDPSGKKTTSVQTVTFTRDATVDEVTGKVTYGNWSENGKHTFDKVDVPYITGYRASEEVPEVTVTPDSKSNTVNVTYVAKTYDVYIFYQKVSTSYDSDSNDSSDRGDDFISNRKSFDRYANGEVGIAKPEVLRGHYGESINIPIKQVQGYYVDPYRNYSNYKFGMDSITGQELSWYDFSPTGDKDLKDPLPENASDLDKEYSMPRFIFVDYIRYYSGYNIGYVDTEGAVISRPTNLRGISGTDTNYTAPTFEGYTLTNPQEVPEKFDKTSKDIFLVYKPQDVKVIYHYVDETGKQLVPSYVENNHFTGLTHVDQKDAKTIPGYSLVSTPKQTVVDGLKDLDLYFTYKANDGSQTISYQDNGQEVGKQVITGKTDQTVKVTPEVPDGYVVKSEIPKEVTIRAKDDAIVITVEHGKAYISPDKPVNKGDLIDGTKDKHYPEGLTHNDLNKTVTREVTITDPSGKKTTSVQTVTFTRGATVDDVTGKVTYDSWSEDGKHTFDKVDVPTVQGYMASGDVPSIVVTPETQSSNVDITYIVNAQHMTITYIDDTTRKTLHTDNLNGVSDQDAKYTTSDIIKQYENRHYKLVSDSTKGQDLIFDHDDDADQTYEVHFVHSTHTINQTTSPKQTIHYVYANDLARQGQAADDNVQQLSFKRDGYNDEVTGTDHWNAWTPANSNYSAVDSPVVQGYTPDKPVIEKSTVNPTDKDTEITVVYNADKQAAHVIYVDKTTNATLTSDDLSGKSDKDSGYNTKDTIGKYESQHYVLTEDETNGKNVIFDHYDKQDQTYYVYFVHGTQKVNRQDTVTSTIDYKFEDGKTAQPTVTQTKYFSEDGVKDLVTDKIAWDEAKSQKFDDVATPVIVGYTPDKDKVAGSTVKFGDSDIEVTVIYHNNAQTAKITYIDDTAKKTLASDSQNGKFNHEITFEHDPAEVINGLEEKGYKLVSNDFKDGTKYKADDKQNEFIVHLIHGSHDISDKKAITETITYKMSDGSTAPDKVEKQVEFSRVGKHDDVTNTDTWNKWQPNKQSFSMVPTPDVKGYTPDIKLVEAKTVTAGDKDIAVTVTYTPDQQKAKVLFIDDTTKKTLDTHNLTGVTNGYEKYSPSEEINQFVDKHYVFVSSDYPDDGFTYDNDDSKDQVFEIHLKHGSHAISNKKSITETITYKMNDGSTAPDKVEKQVEFSRDGYNDEVTKQDHWNKWQPNKQSFSAVPTPEVTGYTPDIKSVEVKTVTAGDKDITVTVTYTPDKQKAKVVFIDDTTKKTLDTHDLTGVTNGHEKYSPSEEIEKFIHDNYVFVSSNYPEKGFTYDNDDSKDQVFEVHLKEIPTESDTPIVPGNTGDNGGSNDTPTDSDEPEKDNGGSDTVAKSSHKTPVKRNSNKKHHDTKKTNKQKNANKKHQGIKKINNQKNAKTAKLNPNKVNTKTNKLTQTKLGKVQESTNNALPQTGNKQSGLMAALGLAISSLGMIGAVKSKKRKDN